MKGRLEIVQTLDDPDLRVWTHAGASDRLVVCFSGIGPDPEVLPGYEFAATAAGGGRDSVLYIADPKRSWLNAPGLIERMVDQIEGYAARIGAARICTLGHSMGGYAALVLPGFTRVDVALALSPQVSVHPQVAGDDPRWMQHRAKIAAHRLRHIEDHLSPATQYFAIYGMHKREAPQRDRFPRARNIELLRMPKTHHNTAQRLKAKRLLDAVVQAAFDGRVFRVRRLIRRSFGLPHGNSNRVKEGSLG